MDHIKRFFYTGLLFFLGYPSLLYAQSYYGINNLGLHTISLTLSLDEEPEIGLGYNYRDFNPGTGNAVLDWQAEVEVSYDFKAYKFSAGLNYLNLDNDFENNFGLGLGAHAFIQSDPDQRAGTPYAGIDVSAYPGFFQNQWSLAPKAGFRYGIALGSGSLSTDTPSDRALIELKENSKIGVSNNLSRNHFYVGALADVSFSENFPSRFTIGLNSELYRNIVLDDLEEAPKEQEEGLKIWQGIRISTSF